MEVSGANQVQIEGVDGAVVECGNEDCPFTARTALLLKEHWALVHSYTAKLREGREAEVPGFVAPYVVLNPPN